MLMLGSLACLSTLLTWLITLCVSPTARRRAALHPRYTAALLLLLAIGGATFPYLHSDQWQQARREAQEDLALTLTLRQAQTLDGIAMPAGTRLRLSKPGEPDTFESAIFPAEQQVQGLDTLQIFRYRLSPERARGRPEQTLSIALTRDQAVDGWLCSHGHRVEFARQDGQYRFQSCHLAQGNRLEQTQLPTGTWLQRADDEAALRWLLRIDGSQNIAIDGLALLKADIKLDAQRHILGFEGLLAQDLELGEFHYPTGTRVSRAGAALPQAQSGDLLLSPSRGRPAKRSDGTDITSGQTVVQARNGAVRAILSNREAGVQDLAAFRMNL